jgi:uncharacterized membrane protein
MSPRPPAQAGGEPTWPAALAVVAALLLQAVLPDRVTIGLRWILPGLEAALLVPLLIGAPQRHHTEARWARAISIGLIALANLANIISLALLVRLLVSGAQPRGQELILAAIAIWTTNVLIFGLWYWELERGGPAARTRARPAPAEFLFPQMANPDVAAPGWRPLFADYLYVSLTNATAFSPTDALPLSRRIKALMALQSIASLLTVALVAARAVNILS